MSPNALEASIAAAWRKREVLRRAGNTAYRVLNREGDGVPEATIDWFDGVAILSFYRAVDPDAEGIWVRSISRALSPRSIYVKRRPKEARASGVQAELLAPQEPAWGEKWEQLAVKENGLSYWIRPGQGLSVGLYLDMREARAWVQQIGAGKSVLNCFAYTCAFGISAAAGGAKRVVNLDRSRKVLAWGASNAELNHLPPSSQQYLAGDVFDHLPHLTRRGESFELVILDPPSFATSKKSTFSAAKDYRRLVEIACPLVSRGGTLLCATNLGLWSPVQFEEQIRSGLAEGGRGLRRLERMVAAQVDFPSAAGKGPTLKLARVTL